MQVVVRIRVGPPRRINRRRPPNRALARAAASVLWPLALICCLTCLWRWSYELEWVRLFLVASGPLSHWQIWFVAGGLLHLAAVQLAHYGAGLGVTPNREAQRMRAEVRGESVRPSVLSAIRNIRVKNRLLWPGAHATAGRAGSVQIP